MPQILTATVPNVEYNAMIEEIAQIKLSKRKAWKSWSKDASGQKTNIYYTSEPLIIRGIVKTHLYKKAFYTYNKQFDLLQNIFKIKDIDVVPVIALEMEKK